jgi:hypothetical protein
MAITGTIAAQLLRMYNMVPAEQRALGTSAVRLHSTDARNPRVSEVEHIATGGVFLTIRKYSCSQSE